MGCWKVILGTNLFITEKKKRREKNGKESEENLESLSKKNPRQMEKLRPRERTEPISRSLALNCSPSSRA